MKNKKLLLFEIPSNFAQVEASVKELGKALNDLNDILKGMGCEPLRTEEITPAVSNPHFLEERLIPCDTKLFGFPIKREMARQLVQLPGDGEKFKSFAASIKENILNHIQNQAHTDMFIAKGGRIEADPAKVEEAKDYHRKYAETEAEKQLFERALKVAQEAVSISKELNGNTMWLSPLGHLAFNQYHLYELLLQQRQLKANAA